MRKATIAAGLLAAAMLSGPARAQQSIPLTLGYGGPSLDGTPTGPGFAGGETRGEGTWIDFTVGLERELSVFWPKYPQLGLHGDVNRTANWPQNRGAK